MIKNLFSAHRILLLVCFVACSHVQNNLHIQATPPAKVILLTDDANGREELGTTPLEITHEKLNQMAKNHEWCFVKLESPGYVSENISLDRKSNMSLIDIKLHPVEWWNDPEGKLSSKVANQIGQAVKNIYREIRLGEIDVALNDVDGLIKQYPSSAIFFDIQGSLFYLKNQKDLAISSFQKSIELDPTNAEALALLKKLKQEKVAQ